MTTNQITIQEFVQREVIYCVSPLIYTLTQENKLSEEYWHLWEAVDWDEAEAAINQNNCHLQQEDNLWGVFDQDLCYYTVEPEHDTKYEGIRAYFGDDLYDYRCEVFEHWLVSSWLGKKLKEKGETVEEDFMGLVVWCRCTTGQAIYIDYVIQQIYNELINK